MLTLVTGGSASGKSEYAENLLCKEWQGKKLYIAAMQPYSAQDAEFQARVARHRALRAGKGFETVERYQNLAGLILLEKSAVLLECLSNLTANELFGGGAVEEAACRRVYTEILRGVEKLCADGRTVTVVTNEIFSDGCGYDAPTLLYIALLGALNRALAARAARVVEVVCGIPLVRKGKGAAATKMRYATEMPLTTDMPHAAQGIRLACNGKGEDAL